MNRKTINILYRFYQNFALLSLIISNVCAFFVMMVGLKGFAFAFWFKAATLGIIYLYLSKYKKSDFYYYQNLGYSKKTLWWYTMALDMIVYLLLIFIYTQNQAYLQAILPI